MAAPRFVAPVGVCLDPGGPMEMRKPRRERGSSSTRAGTSPASERVLKRPFPKCVLEHVFEQDQL
ncbi:hypothetical protein CGZ94_09135 [Enemella evansiae]|uniref:Uncharacterized protein n=1 Tax=Enemella evansiae TaxID=2016499 RepID=A0A255GFV1_9ACTN|nr:hypothetical protein CGZ95_20825 [Enemella evansiae]OYN95863.1 hypothetical protein CGZ96_15355 [Enemella evansiae]OYO04072.1 hypothetical protein CGZ97_11885 [Enemella evansiae]OYO08382.1 hypothetical protein CGZ98_17775 [Enemella evansiae]OYO14717.1 hypothetical protein CGZ94_09135 [Enemella evansiae]